MTNMIEQPRRRPAPWLYTLTVFMLLTAVGGQRGALAQDQWTTSGNNISNTNTGNVGIGTTTPGGLLEVNRSQNGGTTITIDNGHTVASNGAFTGLLLKQAGTSRFALGSINEGNYGHCCGQGTLQLWNYANGPMVFATSSTERMRIDPSGNVGIGTLSPNYRLVVGPQLPSGYVAGAMTVSKGSNSSASIIVGATGPNVLEFGWDQTNARAFVNSGGPPLAFSQNTSVRMHINAGGNVGIGTTTPSTKLHVVGDITVDGNINAKYQDVAEWVPASRKLAAGTVVVLDTEQSDQVTASSKAYDTKVAGVVSARPGVLLGEAGEGKLMVATTGRVKVRVDASRAPIRVGDLLVTSDVEGFAMKSVPLDLAGTPIHRPGTLIGKALEPLAKGVGEILVLLSLQ